MSNTDIRVVPGPANYFSHPGSLAHLNDFLPRAAFPRGVDLRRARHRGRAPFLPESFNAPGAKSICCLKATAASATSPIW
jgi:uncharacterized oxidoreductase